MSDRNQLKASYEMSSEIQSTLVEDIGMQVCINDIMHVVTTTPINNIDCMLVTIQGSCLSFLIHSDNGEGIIHTVG